MRTAGNVGAGGAPLRHSSRGRRSFIRRVLAAVALAVAVVAPAHAQSEDPGGSPIPIGGIPIVLAEHGSETLPIPFAVSVVGLAIFDIATASSSARSYNLRAVEGYRSPRTAFTLSLMSTAAPVALGTVLGMSGSEEAAALLFGGGIVLGPSMGHWYSGKIVRGSLTASLRAGLGLIAGIAAIAAS